MLQEEEQAVTEQYAEEMKTERRTASQYGTWTGGQATWACLAVALHHDVVDVRLQGHADVLPLPSVKLEDVQHACSTSSCISLLDVKTLSMRHASLRCYP